ncbi:hypothetical protein EfmE980_0987 [Enterococcus faecium E980]|nr:hypothetical protein EfmE980_0987 [Enterococcus faecium E980]KXA10396.1 hypothetical protein HMPREF3199_00813 [Enterococcus faecium]
MHVRVRISSFFVEKFLKTKNCFFLQKEIVGTESLFFTIK